MLVWLFSRLITPISNVEMNPGHKNNYNECLSICQWNLNIIYVPKYSKLFLWKVHNSVHKIDFVCCFMHFIENLVILRNNLVFLDHPSNTKPGGVYLYHKNCLRLRVLYSGYLKKCVNFETMIKNKYCNFLVLYRFSRQSQDDL